MKSLVYKIKIIALCLFTFSLGIEYWDPFGIRNIFTITRFAGILYTLFSLFEIRKNLALTPLNKPLVYSMGVLWIWMTFISLVSASLFGAEATLFLGFFQLIALFWLVFNDIVNNPRIRIYIFLSFISGVVLVSILLSLGIGIENVQGDLVKDADGARIYFLGMNPNRMGDMGAMAILLVFSLVFSGGYKNKNRYLLLLLMPSLLTVIGFSGSRGSFILIFLGLSVFFLLKKGKVFHKIMFLIIGGVSTMLIYEYMSGFELLQQRLSSSLDKGDTGGRIRIWEKVLVIIQENPILGVGKAGYDFKMTQIYGSVKDPHNLFLYVWAISGLIGMILLGIFYINTLKRSLMNLKLNGDATNIMIFIAALFLVSKSGGALELKVIWLMFACITPIPYFYPHKGK